MKNVQFRVGGHIATGVTRCQQARARAQTVTGHRTAGGNTGAAHNRFVSLTAIMPLDNMQGGSTVTLIPSLLQGEASNTLQNDTGRHAASCGREGI